MTNRIPMVFLLLRNEITKGLRRKLPYFGLAMIALLSLLVYVIAPQLSNAASANAWGYTGFSMQILFNDLGLIFIVVFAAMMLAEETGTGTIRAALAAPMHRWELYCAKAGTCLLYVGMVSLTGLLCSAALAKLHYDFGAVGDSFGTVYSRGTALRTFVLAYVLSWVPLGALAMYGLFISTLVRTPGAAVAVGISLVYLIDFTKHLVGLDPYIFTRHIAYPWLIVQQLAQGVDYQWQPEVWKMLELSGISALAAFAAGLLIFVRQDLND
jgi:ABC-type transport system involved in multi-copper enzyme maturation permease subunit